MQAWFPRFTGAVVVSALASAAALVATILALRSLPADQAGQFTLITSVAGMLGILALFGQSSLINRVYASHAADYHWPRDLLKSLLISAILMLVGLAVVAAAYRFGPFELAFVAAFALLTVLIQIGAAMLNSYRHYVLSALMVRLGNALLVVPLGLAAAGMFTLTVHSLLALQVGIALLCGMGVVISLRIYLPTTAGLSPIPNAERRESVGLAILTFTHLLLDPGLIVLAGYRLAPADIAGFSAYFTLFGPFLLVWSILLQTIGVEFGRNPDFPKRKILLAVWGALVPVVVLTWLLLPTLASVLYKSKYDSFSSVALPVALMGGLLLTEPVPRGFISVMAPAAALRRYTAIQALFGIAMIALIVLLVQRFQVNGVAWAGVIMLVGRNLIAYLSYFRLQRTAHPSSGHPTRLSPE